MFKNQRKCMNLKVFLICLRNQPKCMKLKLSLHLILLMKQCVKIMDFILILTVVCIVKVSDGGISCKKEITTSSFPKLCPIFNTTCSTISAKSTPSNSCLLTFAFKKMCVVYLNCSLATPTSTTESSTATLLVVATSSNATSNSTTTKPRANSPSNYKTSTIVIMSCSISVSIFVIIILSMYIYKRKTSHRKLLNSSLEIEISEISGSPVENSDTKLSIENENCIALTNPKCFKSSYGMGYPKIIVKSPQKTFKFSYPVRI